MKNIVMVPETLDRRKKTWRKALESVDKSQSNGYSFVGGWLKEGERAELEIGTHILSYDEDGSMKNWYPVVRVHRVTADGLEQVYKYEGSVSERSWALAVRDAIAEIIAGTPEEANPLEGFSTEQLLAELARRGVVEN